jgi:hypothetical protein
VGSGRWTVNSGFFLHLPTAFHISLCPWSWGPQLIHTNFRHSTFLPDHHRGACASGFLGHLLRRFL